ncbi:hypothetical protein [Rhodopila globiformis]|uniref:hypothetical protein n=1 Tax=Rhodopila globiformis TaxID=1071 RepID=UPI001EFE1990|nr:hypothetical protein [Rhodopila globiformis]
MPRLIEIVLFLVPFLGFVAWRLVFPSPLPPLWLVATMAVFVAVMLGALLWVWHINAGDANRPYVPARLEHGRIVESPPNRPP